MKEEEIKIGGIYRYRHKEVEITSAIESQEKVFWEGRNLSTGRKILIPSADRLSVIPHPGNFTPQEEKTMEKTETEKLVERYGTVEDAAEKAKIRRQLRKAGYYLSKNGADKPPAKPEDKPSKPPAIVQTTKAGDLHITVTVNGLVYTGYLQRAA